MSATLNAELSTFLAHFLEDILEKTGYKLTSFNQIDDYGQEKLWKTHRQLMPRKRKNQITSLVEDALKNSNFDGYSSRARDSLASWTPDCIGFNLIEAILCYICRKEQPGAVLVFMTGWDDISCLRDQLRAHPLLGDPNRVLVIACHGSMATSEQKNTENRKKQLYTHTGGSKTIARRKHEEERQRGSSISRGELWVMLHKKKDGSYINDNAELIGEKIINIEREDDSSKGFSKIDSLSQAIRKEHSGRVRRPQMKGVHLQSFNGMTTLQV
ncbi:DExH-box ATP-dependent RNA helicase DExH3-like isoform X2 [Curcuma longa]|uniref:DExH-box ATP-dependent RNA helicase DExH3-like isoform X2 n=1 Tax=Curcuma longa TaxID=136217 RepID=UPI003D9EF14B